MADVRVMIVDDARFFVQLLSNTINGMSGFTVCCTAEDARSAAANITKFDPDLIILDGHMPGIEGPHFLRRIIPQYPVPIIACTSDKRAAKDMLAAGAADFVPKPENGELDVFRAALEDSMRNAMNLREVVCMGTRYRLRRMSPVKVADDKLILIGGSAGSTDVLPHILRGLPADCPPVAVTLHMPEGYTELFVKRLNDDPGCRLRMIPAEEGTRIEAGTAVIAKGAKHLRVVRKPDGFAVSSMTGERISGHCPSVDALFNSAAEIAEQDPNIRMIGVILTGMGYDGADGLLRLKRAGAYTIGQDEKTSMVYGMPKVANELGAVTKQRGMMLIAPEIVKKLEEWKQQ